MQTFQESERENRKACMMAIFRIIVQPHINICTRLFCTGEIPTILAIIVGAAVAVAFLGLCNIIDALRIPYIDWNHLVKATIRMSESHACTNASIRYK